MSLEGLGTVEHMSSMALLAANDLAIYLPLVHGGVVLPASPAIVDLQPIPLPLPQPNLSPLLEPILLPLVPSAPPAITINIPNNYLPLTSDTLLPPLDDAGPTAGPLLLSQPVANSLPSVLVSYLEFISDGPETANVQ